MQKDFKADRVQENPNECVMCMRALSLSTHERCINRKLFIGVRECGWEGARSIFPPFVFVALCNFVSSPFLAIFSLHFNSIRWDAREAFVWLKSQRVGLD